MRKLISILVLFVGLVIYFVSNHSEWMESYTNFRWKRKYIGSATHDKGDLYKLCFLHEFGQPVSLQAKKTQSDTLDHRIYLLCDSYMYYSLDKSNFSRCDSLIKIKWWETSTFQSIEKLDNRFKNVLIIEISERNFRDICSNKDGMTNTFNFDFRKTENNVAQQGIEESKTWIKNFLFNPNINSNLEMNLFDYKIFSPIKEAKAELEFKVFGRGNQDVYLDDKNHWLFYKCTMSGKETTNSFLELRPNEADTLIQNLNYIYDYYRSNGFKNIYLCIVPNPVSMIYPTYGKYNQLIPCIQYSSKLKMPFIDLYKLFQDNPKSYYCKSDSHWGNKGLQTAVNQINDKIETN